ncbi:MAG TPA: PDZ domain-containing protein [Gemmatimonadaceae bacterium]|nr:PDZ domain-containing protein [Gemmatimonadaceae bacterium]
MHSKVLLALGMAAAVAGDVGAQQVRVYSTPRAGAYSYSTADENRAVIGVNTSTGSSRDTLGVLVVSVTPGGPAERAGIEEGNRIASVNGVNLKLAPVDVGDWDMANAMSRRLTRELGKVKPGDDVELRVYGGGQTRALHVKTVASDSLYRATRDAREDRDERAALGVSLGGGSKRDTLGVLIIGLDDEGPSAKAGLEEGNRIASINGVDLRVSREDAGDEFISNAKVARLQRELEKVKAGDEVTLRVYQGAGRTRDVRIKTVPSSDLSRRRTMIFGGSALQFRAPMAPPMGIEFRRQLEEELDRTGTTLRRSLQQGFGRVAM